MKFRLLCISATLACVVGLFCMMLLLLSPANASSPASPTLTGIDEFDNPILAGQPAGDFEMETHLFFEPTENLQTLTIGVASALSAAPDLGWRQANAVQLAVDQANAAGGVEIGGVNYALALVQADSGCASGQAEAAANALIAAGAVAVVGHSCSVDSIAAQPLYAAAGVPMISPSSTSPQLTEQGYATTFRVVTRDDAPPAMLATQLRTRLAHQRAAIVEMDGFWGNWVGDVFSDTFASLGGTITSHHIVVDTADFTPTLTTIMAENPDAVYFAHDDGSTAGLLGKVADNLGMIDVVIAWTTFSENRDLLDDYAAKAGAAAEGDIATMYHRATDDMPGYDDLNAAYQAAGFPDYGDEVQMFGAFAYDAAQIIIAAIDRAESTDPAAIRDEIAATTNHQGVVGLYRGFDAKGDVIPQWMWLERHQNGRWGVFWPYRVFAPIMLKGFSP
jgi:branched-chain amino acid transport system substrate-binding protein